MKDCKTLIQSQEGFSSAEVRLVIVSNACIFSVGNKVVKNVRDPTQSRQMVCIMPFSILREVLECLGRESLCQRCLCAGGFASV